MNIRIQNSCNISPDKSALARSSNRFQNSEDILKDTPFSELSFQLKDVFGKVIKKHKLKVALFCRVYDDGTCLPFSSDFRYPIYSFKNKIHVTAHIPPEMLKENFWYLVPKNGPYNQIFKDFKEMMNIGSLFDYVERFHGYYDVTAFAFDDEVEVSTNKILHQRNELEKFPSEFREIAKNIIEASKVKKVQLYQEMLSNFKGLSKVVDTHEWISALDKDQLRIKYENDDYVQEIKLTKREMECVRHLSLGHTAKQTAIHLGLQFRTVEYYLDNIKTKVGCRKKSEILDKLLT